MGSPFRLALGAYGVCAVGKTDTGILYNEVVNMDNFIVNSTSVMKEDHRWGCLPVLRNDGHLFKSKFNRMMIHRD